MSRKAETQKLTTFEEANAALKHLGVAMREQAQLAAHAQARIDKIKAELAERRVGCDAAEKSLTRLLSKFVKDHAGEIEARGAKTVQLDFGKIGMRTPPEKLCFEKGFKEADVVAAIKRVYRDEVDRATYINTTESVAKDALKLLDEGDLAAIGCYIDQTDIVVIEPALDVPERAVTSEVA